MTKKHCPSKNCGKEMVEVRKAEMFLQGSKRIVSEYPKEFGDLIHGKRYREYRVACPRCKREWIYDSFYRRFEPVVKNSQMRFDWSKGYLVLRKRR